MKNWTICFTVLTALLMMVGCASVSKEDCQLTDWYESGRVDGSQGRPRTAFQGRAKACLEHGINADRLAYYRGHDLGLRYYCTEQKGLELGQKGLPYNSVCPLQLEPQFRAGYNRGMKSYCSEQKGFEMGYQGQAYRQICPPQFEPEFRAGYEKGRELYQYEAEIASLHKQLEQIELDIAKKEKRLYSADLTEKQRRRVRSELKRLDIVYRDVSRELKYLENHEPSARVY